MKFTNFFTGNPLIRLGPLRRDPNRLLEHFMVSGSRSLIFHKDSVLLDSATNTVVEFEYPSIQSLFRGIPPFDPSFKTNLRLEKELGLQVVFLGLDIGRFKLKGFTYWALQISCSDALSLRFKEEQLALGRSFVSLRPAAFKLSPPMAAIVAQARSILDWNNKNQFCSACGSPTCSTEAGYKRECLRRSETACPTKVGVQNLSYPRTDVVAITCVISKDGQRTLLGRKPVWPKGRFSCIAGFLEPSESIEETAYREVLEEAGVPVGRITYHSSQPWPFPSQLMVGCHAQAMTEDVRPIDSELEGI